jgi:hypothetical protein
VGGGPPPPPTPGWKTPAPPAPEGRTSSWSASGRTSPARRSSGG